MKFVKRLTSAAILSAAATAVAGPAAFTIDPTGSSITLSGSLAGFPIAQQGPGSLTTTYSGTGLADLTATSIQFLDGSVVPAANSGNWQPQPGGTSGSSPANYGGQVNLGILGTGRFAVRGLVVDASSAPIPFSGTGFAANALTMNIDEGSADFQSLLATGTEDVSGSSGANTAPGNGTLTVAIGTSPSVGTATLTIPIAATVVTPVTGIGDATLNFNGQLRGTVTSIGGDANFDKVVNISDFATLAANFNQPGTWLAGNFNGQGNVDISDFATLAANFNQTTPRAAVPEPVGLSLLAGATLAMYLRRR